MTNKIREELKNIAAAFDNDEETEIFEEQKVQVIEELAAVLEIIIKYRVSPKKTLHNFKPV